jgi:copper chaperone CopZ
MNQESRNAGTGQESAFTHLEAPEDFSAVYGCASVKISVHLWPKLSCFPAFLIDPVLGNMNDEPDDTDRSLSETMAARIEIKELGDPVRQKEITDAVVALDGVIEAKIENEVLHVSYDPLATSEKKIEQAIRSTGSTVKAAATDTETAHPDLPTSVNVKQK